MDYNATTPLDKQVVAAIRRSLETDWSNPSSQYPAGKEAKRSISHARSAIANMIGAKQPQDIVFVSGGTEVNENNFGFLVFRLFYKHYLILRQIISCFIRC